MKGEFLKSSGRQARALWDIYSNEGRRFDQERTLENMHIFSNTKYTNMYFTVIKNESFQALFIVLFHVYIVYLSFL